MGLRLSQFALRKAACMIGAASALLVLPPSGNATTIDGEAKFIGAPPHLSPIRVSKDQDYCGQTLPNESYLIGPGRGLKNVVVYLERAPESPAPSLQEKENLLDNNGSRMAPRVRRAAIGRGGESEPLRSENGISSPAHPHLGLAS